VFFFSVVLRHYIVGQAIDCPDRLRNDLTRISCGGIVNPHTLIRVGREFSLRKRRFRSRTFFRIRFGGLARRKIWYGPDWGRNHPRTAALSDGMGRDKILSNSSSIIGRAG